MQGLTILDHCHGDEQLPIMVCKSVVERFEEISSECNSHACDVMEYFFRLYSRDSYDRRDSKTQQSECRRESVLSTQQSECRRESVSSTQQSECRRESVSFTQRECRRESFLSTHQNRRDAKRRLNVKQQSSKNNSTTKRPTKPRGRRHLVDVFECQFCKRCFYTDYKLKIHRKLKHAQELNLTRNLDISQPDIKCSFCYRSFPSDLQLIRHQRICTHKLLNVNSDNLCRLCHKSFQSKTHFQSHISGHSTPYTCKCGLHFKWRSRYFFHKRRCKFCRCLFLKGVSLNKEFGFRISCNKHMLPNVPFEPESNVISTGDNSIDNDDKGCCGNSSTPAQPRDVFTKSKDLKESTLISQTWSVENSAVHAESKDYGCNVLINARDVSHKPEHCNETSAKYSSIRQVDIGISALPLLPPHTDTDILTEKSKKCTGKSKELSPVPQKSNEKKAENLESSSSISDQIPVCANQTCLLNSSSISTSDKLIHGESSSFGKEKKGNGSGLERTIALLKSRVTGNLQSESIKTEHESSCTWPDFSIKAEPKEDLKNENVSNKVNRGRQNGMQEVKIDKQPQENVTKLPENVAKFYDDGQVAVVDLSNVDMSEDRESLVNYYQVQQGSQLNGHPGTHPMEPHNPSIVSQESLSRKTSVRCPNCTDLFYSLQDLYFHIENSDCNVIIDQSKARSITGKICRLCNLDLRTFPAYILHLQQKHSIFFNKRQNIEMKACKICNQKFLSDAYLREHVQGKHSSVRRYSCTCGKTFKWRSSFSGHRRQCNGTITCVTRPFPFPMGRYSRRKPDLVGNPSQEVAHKRGNDSCQNTQKAKSVDSTDRIPGVHTILNGLKNKSNKEDAQKPSTNSKVSRLPSFRTFKMPSSGNCTTYSANTKGKETPQTLKTDMTSPGTLKMIENLKQKASEHSILRSTKSNSVVSSSNISSTKTDDSCKPVTSKGGSNPIDNVSASVKNIKTEPKAEDCFSHSHSTTGQSARDVSQIQNTPFGMMLPYGEAMRNLGPYVHYSNAFNFPPVNMQQFYQHILSKMVPQRNVDPSTLKLTDVSNKEQNKPRDSVNENKSRHPVNAAVKTEPTTTPNTPAHNPSYTCKNCSEKFLNKISFDKHSVMCKSRALLFYTCGICGMKLRGKASLREHTLGKHGDPNRYACGCGMKFKWRSSLGSHQKHCKLRLI